LEESSSNFSFDEDKLIKEVTEYVEQTYSEHYSEGKKKRQLMDEVIEGDFTEALGFFRISIKKYIKRFGKKRGFNKLDLLKIIHYTLLLMHKCELDDMYSANIARNKE
jgi:hypothetical protein